MFRKFQTHNEKSKWEKELSPLIRAKRNIRNIPDEWDDIRRGRCGIRCWKQHRLKQYK